MSRASNFIGKPIITQSGKRLEIIDDVIFDPHTHHVLCFIVEPGGWTGGAKILPWTDGCSITPNALIVSPQTQIVLAREISKIQEILENTRVVVGKKIVGPDGHEMGVLNDIYFDKNTGAVQEYEIIEESSTTNAEQHLTLQPNEVEFAVRRGGATLLAVSATTADLIEQKHHAE